MQWKYDAQKRWSENMIHKKKESVKKRVTFSYRVLPYGVKEVSDPNMKEEKEG